MNPIKIAKAVVRRGHAGCSAFLRSFFGIEYASPCYSQYGEDMALRAIFARYPHSYRGFYVDVGAHHPQRFSNTYCFYNRGWQGICIDPVPGGARLFEKYRPRDIFLDVGVSETEATMTYHIFDEPALNTFSEEFLKNIPNKPVGEQVVRVLPLRRILDEHLPAGSVIDFLSIDTEGFDLQVLRSNDWQRYRPRVVIVEEMSVQSFNDIAGLEVNAIMNVNGYRVVVRLPSALIYIDSESRAYDGGAFLNYQ